MTQINFLSILKFVKSKILFAAYLKLPKKHFATLKLKMLGYCDTGIFIYLSVRELHVLWQAK